MVAEGVVQGVHKVVIWSNMAEMGRFAKSEFKVNEGCLLVTIVCSTAI